MEEVQHKLTKMIRMLETLAYEERLKKLSLFSPKKFSGV